MDGVKSFEELNAWKLASALSDEVYRMTESGRVTEDFKFWSQIRDSAASAPRNIAEGWGRYYPNENAPYVRIAKGSLNETKNHLLHGKRVRYFTQEDFNKAFRLVKRALGATTRYLLYLESCGKDVPGQPPRTKRQSKNPNPEPGTRNRERSER